jgi:hypothetical protein
LAWVGRWDVTLVLLGDGVDESTVKREHACVVGDGCARCGAKGFELDDGRWINHSTVTFAKTAGSGGDGLLSNGELEIYGWWSTATSFCLNISTRPKLHR